MGGMWDVVGRCGLACVGMGCDLEIPNCKRFPASPPPKACAKKLLAALTRELTKTNKVAGNADILFLPGGATSQLKDALQAARGAANVLPKQSLFNTHNNDYLTKLHLAATDGLRDAAKSISAALAKERKKS